MSHADHGDGDDGEEPDHPLAVADPDDYSQNQRLKDIHEARRDVRKALKDLPHYGKDEEHLVAHQNLADAVAFYGHELLPLMDATGWEHTFDDSDIPIDSVRHFIQTHGNPPAWEADYPPRSVSLGVFSKLNTFLHDAGLGADLDTDDGDEWEV